MKKILKKGMSGLMAVLVCLTTFIGIGATPAFAARSIRKESPEMIAKTIDELATCVAPYYAGGEK